MRACLLFLCFGLCMSAAVPARGIVIRHDRDDAPYRELGEGFPEVCVVGPAMGTLIDPSWVLTAAHVVQGMGEGQTVRCGSLLVSIDRVVVHPSFRQITNENGMPSIPPDARDLALAHLAKPVSGVTPARLYRDSDELGQVMRFVGDGKTGDGKQGPVADDRVRRGALNRVDRLEGHVLLFTFDPPGKKCLDLEGISGPGDSGGPAFVVRDGVHYVAGVSSGNDGMPECRYGSNEYYMRVSTEIAWIEGVLADGGARPAPPAGFTARETQAPERMDLDPAYAQRIWKATDRLTRTILDEDQAGFEALFVPEVVAERNRKGDPLGSLVGFMSNVMAKRGSIAGFHPLPPQAMMIPDSEFPVVPVIFHLEDGTAGYFGISLDDQDRIDSFSLFVKEEICPAGASCEKTKPLAERVAGR